MTTVYYHGPCGAMNMYGRGIGIYLTLDQAGHPYEMKAPGEMPEGATFAPPCLVMDGVAMGQAPMILSVYPDLRLQPLTGGVAPSLLLMLSGDRDRLGEKFGLAGTTPEEKMKVLHMLGDMNDIFGEAQNNKFEDEARTAKWFSYLEKKLAGSQWLAGTAEPTVADFHGVFAFEWVVKRRHA